MPRVKAIEARLSVSDVERSAAFSNTLGFEIGTLWPQQKPEFAILLRDGLRLQLGRAERDDVRPGLPQHYGWTWKSCQPFMQALRNRQQSNGAPRFTRTAAESSASGIRTGIG
jgi:hypothetical protein